MATRFKKIKDWNMGRGLLEKGFNKPTAVRLLEEELFEFQHLKPNFLSRALLWLSKLVMTSTLYGVSNSEKEHEEVDALDDIIVVATGELYKKGYDADKTMDETIKEISSRRGKINPHTGKFEKFLDDQSTNMWYKAKYDKCKL